MSRTSSTFDGNIVIFENRPFAIEVPALIPNAPGGIYQAYQVEGETVVEAIWGYGANSRRIAVGPPAMAPVPIARSCCAGMRVSPTRSSTWATGSPT